MAFSGAVNSYIDLPVLYSSDLDNDFSFSFYLYVESDGTFLHYKSDNTTEAGVIEIKINVISGQKFVTSIISADGSNSSHITDLYLSYTKWHRIIVERDLSTERFTFYNNASSYSYNFGTWLENKKTNFPGTLRLGGSQDGDDFFTGRIACLQLVDTKRPTPHADYDAECTRQNWPPGGAVDIPATCPTTTTPTPTPTVTATTTTSITTQVTHFTTTAMIATTMPTMMTTQTMTPTPPLAPATGSLIVPTATISPMTTSIQPTTTTTTMTPSTTTTQTTTPPTPAPTPGAPPPTPVPALTTSIQPTTTTTTMTPSITTTQTTTPPTPAPTPAAPAPTPTTGPPSMSQLPSLMAVEQRPVTTTNMGCNHFTPTMSATYQAAGDILQTVVVDLHECVRLCVRDGACRSFVYTRPAGVCMTGVASPLMVNNAGSTMYTLQ